MRAVPFLVTGYIFFEAAALGVFAGEVGFDLPSHDCEWACEDCGGGGVGGGGVGRGTFFNFYLLLKR